MDCHTGQAQGSPYPNSVTNCTYELPGNVTIGINSTNIVDDFSGAESRDPNDIKSTNMSIVTLQRGQTLYAAGLAEDPGADVTLAPGSKPAITTFQGIADPLLAFGRVMFKNSFVPMPVIGGNVNPQATECALYWCVQTLDMSVQNGLLHQNTTQTWFNSSAADTGASYLSPPATGNQAPRNYYIDPLANIPLAQFLEKTFTANMSAFNLQDMTPQEAMEFTEWSSDVAQALWSVKDLDGFMSSLADRMTDTLRNQVHDPSNSPKGNVLLMQTYVHVSWPWLSLPLALVLLSCALLLASIITNHGSRNVVWKNSSLAVLFHGLTPNDNNGYLVSKTEMEESAEEMSVQLREDRNDGLYLVGTPQASVGKGKNRSTRLNRLLGAKKKGSVPVVA